MTEKVIPELKNEITPKIKAELDGVDFVSFTTNTWNTDVSHDSLLIEFDSSLDYFLFCEKVCCTSCKIAPWFSHRREYSSSVCRDVQEVVY